MTKPSLVIEREIERMTAFRDAFERLLTASSDDFDEALVNEVSIAAGLAGALTPPTTGRPFRSWTANISSATRIR